MDRNKLKYLIDAGMGISFLLTSFTGILKIPILRSFLLPLLQKLNFRLMSTIHDWSGVAMGAFVVIHLALNWQWIKAMTKKMLKRQK